MLEKTKNCMLDYMTAIMDEAHDFGWATATGAHALLLHCMEAGKADWYIRRAHAQKIVTNPFSQGKKIQGNAQGTPCKFSTGRCSHNSDHVTNGHSYKHTCNYMQQSYIKVAKPMILPIGVVSFLNMLGVHRVIRVRRLHYKSR